MSLGRTQPDAQAGSRAGRWKDPEAGTGQAGILCGVCVDRPSRQAAERVQRHGAGAAVGVVGGGGQARRLAAEAGRALLTGCRRWTTKALPSAGFAGQERDRGPPNPTEGTVLFMEHPRPAFCRHHCKNFLRDDAETGAPETACRPRTRRADAGTAGLRASVSVSLWPAPAAMWRPRAGQATPGPAAWLFPARSLAHPAPGVCFQPAGKPLNAQCPHVRGRARPCPGHRRDREPQQAAALLEAEDRIPPLL